MKLDASQEAALVAAAGPGHRVITGGAGTGKTTLITALARRLGEVELLAPTGKAAARLREVTGIGARTVHSWLSWDGTTVRRREKAHFPLVIDEASMLDSQLLAEVLRFSPAKLVLVGDGAQLPPVGAGQPFHDLLALKPEIVSELTTCHRAQAAVHRAAGLIRAGELPPMSAKSGGEVWHMVSRCTPEAAVADLLGRIERGQYDPDLDIILACRNEESENSVARLNEQVVALVNPRQAGERWKVGDRIINTKNVNEEDWYNGDTGSVTAVDAEGQLWVQLDRPREQGEMLVTSELARQCRLAYALTVHKAQGSQFRRVFVILAGRDRFMLNRNLLYTAVTRAREGVVVIGELDILPQVLERTATKRTTLQVRAA